MEEKKQEILDNLVVDRIKVLNQQKLRLEEQLTQSIGNEIELPEQFEDQRREKLAEVIKELKILEDEKTTSSGD